MTTDLDTLVRALDPAPASLDAAQRARRDQGLEQILATGTPAPAPLRPVDRSGSVERPGSGPRSGSRPPARRRRVRVRLVLLPVAAAAVGVAGVVLPFLDPGQAAFATWTATPTAVAAGDLAVVDPVCRLFREGTLDGRAVDYRLAATERRGDLVGLLHRSEDPDLSSVCVVRQVAGSRWVTSVQTATGGSSGPAYPAAPGGVTEGAIAELGEISVTDGAVGEGVVAVTVRTGELSVEATVRQGRYYAWWPGPALSDVGGPDGPGGPTSLLSYDVTLSDGTVRYDVEPTPPG